MSLVVQLGQNLSSRISHTHDATWDQRRITCFSTQPPRMKMDDKWSPYKERCEQGQLSSIPFFSDICQVWKDDTIIQNKFLLFVYIIKVTKRLKCKYLGKFELVIIP